MTVARALRCMSSAEWQALTIRSPIIALNDSMHTMRRLNLLAQ
jgi:hypothetical protein